MSTDDGAASPTNYLEMTAEIVSAFVANNHLQPVELAALIASVHTTLGQLGSADKPLAPTVARPTAAQIRKSITPDALISFVDGKPYKMLKRHLAGHGLDLAAYRERYGLPPDYPAVCTNYSVARSALARSIGLGQKTALQPTTAVVQTKAAPSAPAPKPRGRRTKAQAAA